MNITLAVILAGIVIALLIINLFGQMALARRMGGYQDNCKAMEEASISLERRVHTVEMRIEYLPTQGDLQRLREHIEAFRETVSTVHGQNQTTVQLLQSIQKHLLEKES